MSYVKDITPDHLTKSPPKKKTGAGGEKEGWQTVSLPLETENYYKTLKLSKS